MTGRKRDLSAQMEQAAARPAAAPAGKPAGPPPRAKPVRLSVDLAPAAYRGLIDYCRQSAEDLGVARVNGVDVLRSLLAELAEDEALAARVQARLARD